MSPKHEKTARAINQALSVIFLSVLAVIGGTWAWDNRGTAGGLVEPIRGYVDLGVPKNVYIAPKSIPYQPHPLLDPSRPVPNYAEIVKNQRAEMERVSRMITSQH
jgi:hypothetical protein